MEKSTNILYQPICAEVVEQDNGLMSMAQLDYGDVVFNKQGEGFKIKALHKATLPVIKLTQSDGTYFFCCWKLCTKR